MKLFTKNCFLALLCLYRSHPTTPFRGQGAKTSTKEGLRAIAYLGSRYPCLLAKLLKLSHLMIKIKQISQSPFPPSHSSHRQVTKSHSLITPSWFYSSRFSGQDFGSWFFLNSRLSPLASRIPLLILLTSTFILSPKVAFTQSPAHSAGDAFTLTVGDTFHYPLVDNRLFSGSGSLDLSQYKGKVLILDFWATWCTGCIASFPKNDELLDEFGDKLAIVALSYEPESKIKPFVDKLREKRGWKLGMDFVSDHTVLAEIFPHQALPHYVWIGPDGKVAAITESGSLTQANIGKLLSSEDLAIRVKQENFLFLDPDDLFLTGNPQYGKKPLLFQSAITGYVERLQSEFVLRQPGQEDMGRILSTNHSIAHLANTAFGEGDNRKYFGPNRMFLELENPGKVKPGEHLRGDPYLDWKKENTYCYELLYPIDQAEHRFRFMQEDLRRFFPQYLFTVETREMEVWQIILGDGPATYAATQGQEFAFGFTLNGGLIQNIMLNGLVGYLNMYLMYASPHPVVDCTGIEVPVTLKLDADMTDPIQIAAALRPYGLDMVKARMPLEVLVIRDSNLP